jgi:hypothetical protein
MICDCFGFFMGLGDVVRGAPGRSFGEIKVKKHPAYELRVVFFCAVTDGIG